MRFIPILVMTILAMGASAQVEQPFKFVHMSDTHIGSGDNEQLLLDAFEDMKKTVPDAKFAIVTGDLTEYGFEDEFTTLSELLKKSPFPIYGATGNHDVRWSDSGKENFRKFIGPTFQSFDEGGVRFILLDSAMLIEHYGHFDGAQLRQLEQKLSEMPDGMPAVLALHHPPLSPGHYIDNEQLFASLISKYNVPLVLTGHGHSFQDYTVNDVTYSMGGSTFGRAATRGYRIYEVFPDRIKSNIRYNVRDRTELELVFSYPPRKLPNLRIEARPIENALSFDIRVGDEPATGTVSLTFNQVTSHGLELEDGSVSVNLPPHYSGLHYATVALPLDGQTTLSANSSFVTDGKMASITRAYHIMSGGQSNPAVEGNTLFVGSNDGHLRAFDLDNTSGTVALNDETSATVPGIALLWETHLGSEVLSSPVITSNTVVVGSMDSHVYALDKKTGSIAWKFKTGQAVLATPLVAENRVYIGSGDKHMYCLDLKTGEEVWKFKASKLIKATPALAQGKLLFGAWDNRFYCLDAETGELVWNVPISKNPNGHFSAATSNPVVHEDTVIFCSHDYTVRGLWLSTGATRWAYTPTVEELGPSYSTAVIKDGVAYFGSINGHVVGHDVVRGTKVFDVNVRPEHKDDLFDSLPRLVGDKIYIGSVNGNLYCVDISKEVVDWSVALQPGFIFTAPAIDNDRIYVSTLNDRIYEITTVAKTGQE